MEDDLNIKESLILFLFLLAFIGSVFNSSLSLFIRIRAENGWGYPMGELKYKVSIKKEKLQKEKYSEHSRLKNQVWNC